jgi:hypothetical protein
MQRSIFLLFFGVAGASGAEFSGGDFPLPLGSYADPAGSGVWQKVFHRISVEPFNLVGTVIFLAAIVHTFLVARFRHRAHFYEHEYENLERIPGPRDGLRLKELYRLRFRATLGGGGVWDLAHPALHRDLVDERILYGGSLR